MTALSPYFTSQEVRGEQMTVLPNAIFHKLDRPQATWDSVRVSIQYGNDSVSFALSEVTGSHSSFHQLVTEFYRIEASKSKQTLAITWRDPTKSFATGTIAKVDYSYDVG